MTNRKDELASHLHDIRNRVSRACNAAGRDADEVTIIAVTKTWPLADVLTLYDLGVRDFGESKDQEAKSKFLVQLPPDARRHFIGQIQTNKIRSIASYSDLVHAVDRQEVIEKLERAADQLGRTFEFLLQVSLSDAPEVHRAGVSPSELESLMSRAQDTQHIRCVGLMAVAPLNVEPQDAFERLGRVWSEARAHHPDLSILSAGMSEDLEQAIRFGATHVRIGSALLGNRSYPA
jgi:pyridoxal phosphate enzyme (YggS family)